MQSQNLSNIHQDIQSITRDQRMDSSDSKKKDRFANLFDSQGSLGNSKFGESPENDNRISKDKHRPGSSQERSHRNNDPLISRVQMEFSDDNDNDNYETLTEGGMEKKTQKLLDEQEIYQTLIIGPNNRTNPNPNEPNKIGPNSEVPPNEKEKKEKPKREPSSSDTPYPLSQQYQPDREAQHQISPKVLRNPNKPSSPSELQITSNPKVQPDDPSGGETGRFPSQNPKLNPRSIPEYPSRFQYQGPRPKKPSPKKRSPNYGQRGNYPSQKPQFPNNPRNPPRGNPRYPSRDNPRNPPRGNPRYPSRGNPRYPSRDNPQYPPGDNPQYPPGDNPRNPNYPPNTGLDSRMRRPLSTRGPNPRPNNPIYGYPRRYRDEQRGRGRDITFGDSLGRSHSRSNPSSRKQSPADIPFSYPTGGRCFACDVDCSISRSGNSPNKYVPYFASLKKERKAVTDYDAEKYGYYQYSSTFSKNINTS